MAVRYLKPSPRPFFVNRMGFNPRWNGWRVNLPEEWNNTMIIWVIYSPLAPEKDDPCLLKWSLLRWHSFIFGGVLFMVRRADSYFHLKWLEILKSTWNSCTRWPSDTWNGWLMTGSSFFMAYEITLCKCVVFHCQQQPKQPTGPFLFTARPFKNKINVAGHPLKKTVSAANCFSPTNQKNKRQRVVGY